MTDEIITDHEFVKIDGGTLCDTCYKPAIFHGDHTYRVTNPETAAPTPVIAPNSGPSPFLPPPGPLMELSARMHERARSKGWWDEPPEVMALSSAIAQRLNREGWVASGDVMRSITEEVRRLWPKRNIGELMMLMVTEISEAYEAYRHGELDHVTYGDDGKPEGGPVEIADLLIRVFDFIDHRSDDSGDPVTWDMDDRVAEKDAFNATRPHRHGGLLA